MKTAHRHAIGGTEIVVWDIPGPFCVRKGRWTIAEAKREWIRGIFYEEGIASGGQWFCGVTRKSLSANAIQIPDEDVGADQGYRSINGGRADRSRGGRASSKEEEPAGEITRAYGSHLGTEC
jgi:hypothetical protein